MSRSVVAKRTFTGPWWVAVALLGSEPEALVSPVQDELEHSSTRPTRVIRPVEVDCGSLKRGATSATMAVHWRDAAHADVLPEMDGEIRLVERGPNETELCFVGNYIPPFGGVAQRAVDDLVERLAARFEAAVSEQIGTRPAEATREPERPGQ